MQTSAYDSLGNVLSETDAAGNVSRREYDLLERLAAVVDAKGHRTTFTYNARGQRLSVTNPDGKAMDYTRDALGRVTREQWRSTPSEFAAYRYDGAGNVLEVTDALNHTTVYGYDGLSRLSSVTQPGAQVESYVYDARGRLSQVLDAMGHKIVYEYDAWSSAPKAEKHYATTSDPDPARTITYTRNELGDLTGVSDSTVNGGSPMYTFVYDELNRVAEARAQFVPGGVRVLASQYDRRGFRDLMRWTGDGAARDHALSMNAQGRVTDATLPGGQAFGFDYYANDLVKDVTRTSGTATHYTYEATGELKAASVVHAQNTIETLAYYYTPSGQISARTDHEGTHSYGYTPTYRLSEVQNPAGSVLPASETFAYDAVGNRTNVSGVSSYDVNNRMIGTDIAFDANGNLTSKPGATFTWDMKNRLREFDNGTDTQASYTYDPFGRRIKKTVTTGSTTTTTYFLWDGDQLLAEYNGSGALTKRYAYLGGYAPAQVADVNGATETIYDVHTDHLDTPKFLTNQTGAVVWRARHEAYGEAIVNENPDGDSTNVTFNLRFPGQYFDAESGLHYNHFRYYDTEVGRYISADPIGQWGEVNTYLYAGANPISSFDPSGLFAPAQVGISCAFLGWFSRDRHRLFMMMRRAMRPRVVYLTCTMALKTPIDIAWGVVK